MSKPSENKPSQTAIRCPQCGSTDVRLVIFRRANVGCLLLNLLAFVTVIDWPGHCCRACRKCGHRFTD